MIEDDLSVPPHWPKTVRTPEGTDEQSAIKVLAEVRRMIVAYRQSSEAPDWRVHHAQTKHIVNVVAGLIADATAIDALYSEADKRVRPLEDRIKRLEEELAEAKRPFTAQMEMQNRRIIDLNRQIEELQSLRRGHRT